jgi:hypothetical protein
MLALPLTIDNHGIVKSAETMPVLVEVKLAIV